MYVLNIIQKCIENTCLTHSLDQKYPWDQLFFSTVANLKENGKITDCCCFSQWSATSYDVKNIMEGKGRQTRFMSKFPFIRQSSAVSKDKEWDHIKATFRC